MNRIITSQISILPNKLDPFDEVAIKNEPMLFNCDAEYALKLGGPITQNFLETIPIGWRKAPCVIDTRVHMLMPGWYSCIPGWHHDDVPRTRVDKQPNYDDDLRATHIMALQNANVCPTQFALGTAEFPEVPEGNTVYEKWSPLVSRFVAGEILGQTHIQDQELIQFDDRTWHRGTPAIKFGWRWFGRISRYEKGGKPVERPNPRTNEVRRQVQVYLSTLEKGW